MRLALDHSDLVRRLIVVDMGVKTYERGHDEIFAAMRSLPLDDSMSRPDLDRLLAKEIPQRAVRQFLLKNLRRNTTGYAWKLNLEVLEREYHEILRAVAERGETWAGAALFIRGADSPYIPEADWSGIQQVFPQAELATIVDAGHWVHADQPEALVAAIRSFLGTES